MQSVRSPWPTRPSVVLRTTPPPSAFLTPFLPDPTSYVRLPTEDVCWWWRTSYVMLQRATSTDQRQRLASVRATLLDILAGRAPQSFQKWLASGARAASDPTRYFMTVRRAS